MVNGEIELKAKNVLFENNAYEIPVDPVKLAEELKIKIKNTSFNDDDVSGIISIRDGENFILVNIEDSYERKRFTVAHELGHYFLHLQKENGEEIDMHRKTGNENLSSKEREANQFAAALLMEKDLITNEFKKLSELGFFSESEVISALSNLFQVSISAVTFRLNNLSLIK